MILSHLMLGFVTSYVGYTPPSMLNITASRIRIQNNKKVARQFIWGASIIVLFQVFLAVLLASFLEQYPQLIIWVKHIATIVFTILAISFLVKGLTQTTSQELKPVKNGFLFGISLSSVNMFAIPFFAVAHSSFVMHGWAMTGLTCTTLFGIGTVLGTFAILSSYIFLAQKLADRLLIYTKYFNIIIGLITGGIALYSMIKLYI